MQPKMIGNFFYLLASVSKIQSITVLQTEPNETTAQCQLWDVLPACFGRCQSIKLATGH